MEVKLPSVLLKLARSQDPQGGADLSYWCTAVNLLEVTGKAPVHWHDHPTCPCCPQPQRDPEGSVTGAQLISSRSDLYCIPFSNSTSLNILC